MNKRQKKKSIKKKVYFSFYKYCSLYRSHYSNYKKVRVYFNAWECHDKQLRKVRRYRLQLLPRNLYKL